jgi:hypothetical protein
MRWSIKYIFALLPAAVTVGGWQGAVWAYDHFHCQGGLKDLKPCFAGRVDILLYLGLGLFWCQLFAWIAVPISLWCIFSLILHQAFPQSKR